MGSPLKRTPRSLIMMCEVKTALLTLCLTAWGALLLSISVSISPYPQTTQVQQSFAVSVQLDTSTQIRGYSLSIAYDQTKISYTQATRGAIFTGMPVNWWRVNTDTPGVLHVECIIFGTGLYTTGPGTLLNTTFTALEGDFSSLEFNFTEIYDVIGNAYAHVDTNGGAVIIGNQPGYFESRCFLQGAYSDGWMNPRINSIIPLTSPYPSGVVSVSSIPADMVDWVLVELRTEPYGSPVASQAALLHEDGIITSAGKPFLLFMNISPGPYYLVLRHRNHLAVLSADTVNIKSSGVPEMLDMSNVGNISDRAGIIEYDDGSSCAMLAGDADMDGGVFPSDRNNQWRPQNGQSGYKSADFNLNGIVSNSDLMLYWRTNAGAASLVP